MDSTLKIEAAAKVIKTGGKTIGTRRQVSAARRKKGGGVGGSLDDNDEREKKRIEREYRNISTHAKFWKKIEHAI